MTFSDLVRANEGEQHPTASRRERYSKGWEPRVTQTDSDADAVSDIYESEVEETTLIQGWNLNPDEWAIIDGTLTVNRWQAMTGHKRDNELVWLYQYKARLRRRRGARTNIDELLAGIGRHKAPKPRQTDDRSLVVCMSDWQIGKGDGDGVRGTVDRITESIHRSVKHAKQMKPSTIYLVGMGDLVEQCSGNYPGQAFTVELNRREQIRVARRLLRDWAIALSKLCVPMVVSAVGGNHGENRQNGKAFTDPADNDDVGVLEQVAEALAQNPSAFDHVAFAIPDDELAVAFDMHGKRSGFTHGHLAKKGATPEQKQRNWWADQLFGDQPIGDVDYLFTAHYHHASVVDLGPRVLFCCPPMEDQSTWWVNQTGARSAPGALSVMIDERGWDDLKIL